MFQGVEDTLPIEPWHIGGPVIEGFGRGSKVLGIPTANLSTNGYSELLTEHPSGVFFGWAALSSSGVYKMVMSIGWNPYFNNKDKTIEPRLLHDFEEDFYGEELHLVIVEYIRPEANFPSLEALLERIHDDRRVAENALSHFLTKNFLTKRSGLGKLQETILLAWLNEIMLMVRLQQLINSKKNFQTGRRFILSLLDSCVLK
ncbi:hypothetical protein MLD38_032381 [Melastoma candidum]|uniref:Uncharacterized protein n=1 Tax=Melastoma candidum TaxID=119954 RepID=A0ACB9M715_9MYRT|nr:hypothetical protein MLD38_032381 [Melastoma candidum]